MASANQGARSPSILVFSQTEWLARSFESILIPRGCSVIRAHQREEVEQRFDALSPDVVLLESDFGHDGAGDLCRALRAHPRVGTSTPILVVSAGPLLRPYRLQALRAGAWDAFGFPLDAEELVLKVMALASVRMEVGQAEERGLLDPHTGLYNARGLVRRAQEMVAEAYRHHKPLACIAFTAAPSRPGAAIDPAELDRLMDVLGELLRVAGRLSDVIGRMRGTEFAILAPETNQEGADRLAERLGGIVESGLQRAASAADVKIYSGRFAIEGNGGAPHVQPVEMLVNATHALRSALTGGSTAPTEGNGGGSGKTHGPGNGSGVIGATAAGTISIVAEWPHLA